jgi:DHA3 family tetracycline resistance protein-like MFS transporter
MNKLTAARVFLLIEAVTSLLFGMIFTISSLYQVSTANLSALQLVLVGTVLELSIFVFEVPTGVVADLVSRRLSVIIGFFLIGAGFILEGALPIFWTILLAQILWGVGYTFTSGATQAWITDEIGEDAAGPIFLRASQISGLAGLLGIPLGVVLGRSQINLPLLIGGSLFAGLAVFLILFMPEDGFTPTPQGEHNTWQSMLHTLRGGLAMVRRRPALWNILLIGLFFGLYSEGYDRLWVKHLTDNLLTPGGIQVEPVVLLGAINAGGTLLAIAATELVRRRLDTTNPNAIARMMMAASALMVAGLIAFAQARSLVLAIGMIWLIDVFRSINSPLYTTWVNQRLDPQVRATVLSMSSQVDAIGQITSGPALGMVGSLVSVRAAITASGLLLAPILGLFVRALRMPEAPLAAEPEILGTDFDLEAAHPD